MPKTIDDIAKEAGVSKATVSRVMNNTKAVSPELKEKVNQIIEKNNFKPNTFARGLITKKTQTIGVIVSDISNPVDGIIIKGINQICMLEEYTLMVSESGGETEKELELIEAYRDRNIDGIIIVSNNNDKTFIKELSQKEHPIVLIGVEELKKIELNIVYHDALKASYDATNLILSYGHKRIGFIGGPNKSSSVKVYEGFCNALDLSNLKSIDSFLEHGDYSYHSGYECMKKIHLRNNEMPTAVLICNDSMAIGAIHYIQSIGLKVPNDISIVGLDGLEVTSYFNPSLTTVEFPYHEEGIIAAQILFDTIKDETKTKSYYLEHKITERNSLIKYEKSSGKEMEVYLL